jgi:hypothetical protein
MNPKQLAEVIAGILKAEDEVLQVAKELKPLAAQLPAPFNVLANPLVQKGLDFLPKLTPFLKQLESVLESISQ